MKRIIQHLKSDWYKYALELIVITAGILGAFALNNWNENRKETEIEKRFLTNLKGEVMANQMSLEENIQWHKQVYDHIVLFMNLTGPDATNTDQATFDSLIYSIIRLPSYEPAKGNISSAELDDLDANQLKVLIAKWNLKIEDYHRSVKITYDLYYNLLFPELSQHYQLKNMNGEGNFFDLKSRFAGDQTSLLRNPKFENHLTMRAINAKYIYDRALDIHSLQEKIIEQIDEKLEEL